MKNQYFADVNDYRKYGLLRTLTSCGQLQAGVGWMLTHDDGGSDGRFFNYLEEPDQWRQHDSELFDQLKACLAEPSQRSVTWADLAEVIPGATYFSEIVPSGRVNAKFTLTDSARRLPAGTWFSLTPITVGRLNRCHPGAGNPTSMFIGVS